MPAVSDYFDRKTSIPSEMRTREWSGVDAWIRERAFFSASVDKADVLDGLRKEIGKVTRGELDAVTARKTIRQMLDSANYEAEKGLEGTIKDLRSTKRLDVLINTNVDMANGWAQHNATLGNASFPGMALYRSKRSTYPRDWVSRVAQFSGRDDVILTGNNEEPMYALSNSPVWTMISRLGTSHPPYDFNSGMWTRPLSYKESLQVGLITEENEDEMLDRVESTERPSLNESVEVKRDYSEKYLRDELSNTLKGLAEWEGNVLKMTDPNGTKKYDADKIGQVIGAPLPEGFEQMQAKAFKDWIKDSSNFTDHGIDPVGLDEREDFIRLTKRINPETSESGEVLRRGLSFKDNQERDSFLEKIQKDNYGVRPGQIAESWANNKFTSETYAGDNGSGVVLRMKNYKSRIRIDDLYRKVAPEFKGPNPKRPIELEGESLFMNGVKFRVVKTRKEGGLTYVDVEEI